MLRLSALLLGFLSAGAAIAAETGSTTHAHGHDPRPGKPRTTASELAATATFDAQGRLWAVTQGAGHVSVQRSDDQGRTWTPPVRVNPAPEALDPGGDSRPKIAIGTRGEVYVTWTKELTKPYTGEIRFARSLDDGKSFQAPRRVHQHPDEITHRFDTLAVDHAGRIFVAWIDRRDALLSSAAGRGYRGAALYFAISADGGASFQGDFKVADHSCECCRIALAPHVEGGVVALWRHIFFPNIRDHATARLHPDGRVSDVLRATLDDWRIDACPHHGPSLALDAGGIAHAAWFTATAEGGAAYYGRLGANGMENQRRLGGKLAAHADLAVEGPRLAVAWKEFMVEHTRLRALTSEDGGKNWREHELRATTGQSDQPRVLHSRGRFFVFWNTRENPLTLTPLP